MRSTSGTLRVGGPHRDSGPVAAEPGDTGGQLKFDAVGTLLHRPIHHRWRDHGIMLTTDHGVYELSLFGEMARKAEALNGKKVHVTGTLNVVAGVEVKERRIAAVAGLAAVDQPILVPNHPMAIPLGPQS